MIRVLSGVQPTGNLHLGNYLGAIRQWVAMQKGPVETESLFCIVDLHAITVPQDPQQLLAATRMTAAAYIACGIDPDLSAIFVQSSLPEHSEMAWVLSCFTPLGWLNRMTQFKEKAGKHKENACLGLYSYPVLMAADILLYKATHVPVGEDQKQHLELTRDIAGAFNRHYHTTCFPLPEPLILKETPRIMSLRDGMQKMSKSDLSEYSRIHLTDDADTITNKIKKAKSDAEAGVRYDIEKRPEASNLVTIYAALTGQSRQEVEVQFADKGFAYFKKELADRLISHLAPITKKIKELQGDISYIDAILLQGKEKASAIAEVTMKEVKETIGFLSFGGK